MKWYVIPPLITCGLNSMLAAIVLSLAAFHLYTDKSTNAPIEPNEEWICLVKWLGLFAAFWLTLSIAGMYVSMTRRQMWRATLVLVLYAACFGVSVYFTIAFGSQLDVKEVESEVLYKTTLKEISEHTGDAWIPGWLDNVQKQSKVCCGIMTYRDYEEFWPTFPSKIPHSCCKDNKLIPLPCPADLSLIPFPNTPGDFVKVEMGCMPEILESVRHHIRESYQNSITTTIFIGCGILAYVVLYTKRYLDGSEDMAIQQQKDIAAAGGGDIQMGVEGSNMNKNIIIETSSGPLIITSSGQMAGSIDSFEGIPTFGSVDSFPAQQLVNQARQYIPDQSQFRQQTMSIPVQQQQPLQYQVPQQSVPFQTQQQMPSLQIPLQQQSQQYQIPQMQQQSQQYQMPQQSQQYQIPQMQQQPQQYQSQMQQPSGPVLNKTNVVLASLQQQMQQQQQQQQSPQVMDTSMTDNNMGINGSGISSPRQQEAYNMSVSGTSKPQTPEQSSQVPSFSMPRSLLSPMVAPDIVVTDNNVARMEQQQQTQDTSTALSPPGSPTGRRKKVRKEALVNRNK